MPDDHAQLRKLRQEIERKEAAHEAVEPESDPEDAGASSGRSDSEQAQANLERMLETGEENPIS